jgi:hypothetical protein
MVLFWYMVEWPAQVAPATMKVHITVNKQDVGQVSLGIHCTDTVVYYSAATSGCSGVPL